MRIGLCWDDQLLFSNQTVLSFMLHLLNNSVIQRSATANDHLHVCLLLLLLLFQLVSIWNAIENKQSIWQTLHVDTGEWE